LSRWGRMGSAIATGVSVVIPCHQGRRPWVERLLESLVAAAEGAPEPSEVIGVDDSSGSDAARLERICTEHAARYLRGPATAGGKRNAGSRAARYDVVLFIDSDCAADPRLLVEVLLTMRASDERMAAVLGLTAMVEPEPHHWRVARYSRLYNKNFEYPMCFERVLWGAAANFACRRTALERIGGFDESPPTRMGGEDVDIGVRLNRAGYHIVSNPRAVVWHARDHIRDLRPIMRSLFRFGRADVYLLRRYPERGVSRPGPGLVVAGGLLVAGSQLPVLPIPVRVAGLLGGLAGIAALGYRLGRAVAASAPFDPTGGTGGEGRDAQPASDPEASWSYRARLVTTAYAIDQLFAVGSWFEALRQRRPWLALRRFDYLGPEARVWRTPPPLPVEQQREAETA
jgi:GT2 family glycosyltransferase